MGKMRFAFIADIHYYSSLLGTSGRAYDIRSGADQKCLAESGAVTDAVLKKLSDEHIDALMIAGDLTNDGEKCSHIELKKKLEDFNKSIPVYLITSTHDWCSDNNARSFFGNKVSNDVEVIYPDELNAMYADFGKDKLIAEYKTSKGFYSRVFQVADKLRLIAVNDDCDGKNGKSGYSEYHLRWMEQQIYNAKNDGNAIIAMEHHLLLHNISPLINSSQSIADNYSVAARLADAGLRLMFTGHSHMQRTTEYTSPSGNIITQVNLGSICGYPAPITYITVNDTLSAEAEVEFLNGFTYEDKPYTSKFFEQHTANVFYNLLNAAVSDKNDFFERLNANGIKTSGIKKFHPVIKKASNLLLTANVGKAAKIVNFFTFGKGIKKANYKNIVKEQLMPHIIDTFLNVFDGSYTSQGQSEDVKKTVCDVATLPSRVIKHIPLKHKTKEKLLLVTGQIKDVANELCYPSTPDNFNFSIEFDV